MIKALLITILFSYGAPKNVKTKKICEHSPKSAEAALHAIYTAEKATHAEINSFSEDFQEIGFAPDLINDCDIKNWDFDITVDSEGQQFIAQAKSKLTQNIWIIDHNKNFVKVY